MRSLAKLAWVETKLRMRDATTVFFALAFPVLLLAIFGAAFGNSPTELFGGRGTVEVLEPAYAALVLATTGFLGVGTQIVTYRELGILRRYRATPLTPLHIVASQIASSLALSTLGTTVLIGVGWAVFGVSLRGGSASAAAALSLSAASLLALGFLIASVARTVSGAQGLAFLVFYPMIFLSGATLPREFLPSGLQRWSEVLPLTHVVTLLRAVWAGSGWHGHFDSVIILIAVFLASMLLTLVLFRWE